ncbi:hypothetical protein HKK72_21925 [Actinomadura sp. HBU206391]|nr:hypothetical protein [Actinomadura sp. HBU206391]
MVVLWDRPVVAFNQWLADALRVCGESGRGLQIVTPVGSRLSLPLKLVLTGPTSLWVVRDGGGYYDGLTGRPLRWDGAAFSPVPEARDYAPGYTTRSTGPVGAQLTLTFRIRHGSGDVLGGVVAHLCRLFTGHPPLGWGTAEPAANLWSLDEMNGLIRRRSPRATWLAVVGGRPAAGDGTGPDAGENGGTPPAEQHRTMVGTMLLTSEQGGAEEAGTLVFGFSAADPPPVSNLSTLIGTVAAEHRLASLFAQLSPGRPDLTTEPRWMGAPAPIGMAVGAEMGMGSAPPGVPGRPIGDPGSAVMWFELGDGRSSEGWQRYEQLMRHLRPPA